jgi:hypothetical protein
MNDDIAFAEWQGYYHNNSGNRATLGISVRRGDIILLTETGDHLHFAPSKPASSSTPSPPPSAPRGPSHDRSPGKTLFSDCPNTISCPPVPSPSVGAAQPLGQAGGAISMYIGLPSGGAGTLTIDPDRVDAFVRYMEQALLKLRDAYNGGRRLIDVEPPGHDPFSPRAVDDIRRTAGEEPGGHLYANLRAQEVYQAIIDNARASLAAYRESEARGADRFRGDS